MDIEEIAELISKPDSEIFFMKDSKEELKIHCKYNWISENKPIDKKVLMMVGLTELSRFEVFSTFSQDYIMTIDPTSLSARVPNIINRYLELTKLTKRVSVREI